MNALRVYLVVSICLGGVGIFMNMHWLCNCERDRTGRRIEARTVGQDACLLVIRFAWLAWIIWLTAQTFRTF
jgi:hypothetical protein